MADREFSGGSETNMVLSKKKTRIFGARELVLAGALSTLGAAVESGCHNDEKETAAIEKNWSAEQVKFHLKDGDWEFFIFEDSQISLANSEQKNFHDFLWNFLGNEAWFKKLPEQDRQAYIDGLIDSTRQLNPGLNLDDFLAIKGTPLKMPVRFLADPNPAKIFSKTEGGYSRLQELAEADGFEVRTGDQQEIYKKALAASQEIPVTFSFYLDRQGSEDSPPRLMSDVIRRFDLAGKAFEERSFDDKKGWKPCMTDIMRDLPAQIKRHKGEEKPMVKSTHDTARSADVSDGRFLSPDGLVVTYSEFDEEGKPTGKQTKYATMIEQEMRPALEEIFKEYGIFAYKEGAHWHTYVPEARMVDLQVPLARCMAQIAGEEVKPVAVEVPSVDSVEEPKDEEEEEKPGFFKRLWGRIFGSKEPEPEVVEYGEVQPVGSTDLERKLNNLFVADYQKSVAERLTSAEVDTRLAELQPVMDWVFFEAFPGKKGPVENTFLTIFTFPNFSDENREKFGDLTFEKLKEEAGTWRLSDQESEKKKWRAVSQAWLKDRVIEIVKKMPPGDAERIGILAGSTVHGKNRPPFADLPGIWRWKSQHKTNDGARNYVDAVLRLDLQALDGSVDVATWRQKEQTAIDLLRRHGDKFGFRSEVLNYLTPEVMEAVMNAEFFSELDGRTFVETLSTVFDYNIVFGPSANDRLCSAGPVQLIESTFVYFLDNYADEFAAIKSAEKESANFVIPARTGWKKERRRKVGVYDPDSFAEAMVGNPDSVIFYATFSVVDHTRGASNTLFVNKQFREKWDKASDEDRLLFVGSLAPLAINGGPGTAIKAAQSLLVDSHLKTLRDMAVDLPTHTNRKNARRGAECGFDAMNYIIQRAEK